MLHLQNHQSRGSSVHSLVVPSLEVHAKEDVSPSRSASSGNLQPKAPLQMSEQGIESETSCVCVHLYLPVYTQMCVATYVYIPTNSACTYKR